MVAGNDCETFWDKDQLTDSCYQFNFQSTLSWREAWASCEQQGADLLSITEIHEQTYINGEAGAGGSGQDPKTCPTFEGGPEPFLLLLEGRMQLVGQLVEDWGWDDPLPHCRPLVVRAPHWLQLHTVDWP